MTYRETEPDSTLRITVSAHCIGSVVSITVDDTWPRHAAKGAENLFTAFRGWRVQAARASVLRLPASSCFAHGGTIALVGGCRHAVPHRNPRPAGLLDDYRSCTILER